VGVLVFAGGGCGGSTKPRTKSRAVEASIRVTSDFASAGVIPRIHTCDGRDLSPPLRAAGIPPATKELVIVMVDHDAPGGDFIHWALAHVEPGSGGSRSGGSIALSAGQTPAGAVLGVNSFGSHGYRGPCPPRGDPAHHYEITVYALAQPSGLQSGFSAGAVSGLNLVAIGGITGVYKRR
jgi:Raf kinase inhibitor-like YbhB/YbcL family protein